MNTKLENALKYANAIKEDRVLKKAIEKQYSIQAKKTEWIKLARKNYLRETNKKCFVCGGYHFITEGHHILPLSMQFDLGFDTPNHSLVYLCPNHHKIAHLFNDSNDAIIEKTSRHLTDEEIDAFMILLFQKQELIRTIQTKKPDRLL